METRIDHIAGGIYRISTWAEPYGITFNQFLIDELGRHTSASSRPRTSTTGTR